MEHADAQEWLESLQQVGEGWYRQLALAVRMGAHKALGMERREFTRAIGQRMIDPHDAIEELYRDGHSQAAIADVLKVGPRTVRAVLIERGLIEASPPRLPPGENVSGGHDSPRETVSEGHDQHPLAEQAEADMAESGASPEEIVAAELEQQHEDQLRNAQSALDLLPRIESVAIDAAQRVRAYGLRDADPRELERIRKSLKRSREAIEEIAAAVAESINEARLGHE